MTKQICFILNEETVTTQESPGLLVLDYLRKKRRLIGTKEGCKEGDCGACTVLIGERQGDQVHYQPVTSCLVPLGELHGKHLVSVEGINMQHLSPVQQAIVEEGGSQCGFCTPGIVVSLTWYLMTREELAPTMEGIEKALSGHLCRCTGYSSLRRAGQLLINSFQQGEKLREVWQREDRIEALIENDWLPRYFQEIPARLASIPALSKDEKKLTPEYFVAGGTDIYVQQGEELPESKIQALNLFPEMKKIYCQDGHFHVGSLVTFEEFANHRQIIEAIPRIQEYMLLVASLQLRNRATLGGNIVNASPIGDMTILLLALDSVLKLQEKGQTREVEMKSFFKGYKSLEKRPQEILTEIVFPIPSPHTRTHFEKISKRQFLDIASVNSAMQIEAGADGTIHHINITMGGVAPIPLFLEQTSSFLRGKKIAVGTIQEACQITQEEISPISDVRGSQEYKRLLARQLLLAHFVELYPEYIRVEDFYSKEER